MSKMSGLPPVNHEDIAALTEHYYDQLISYGIDAANHNPIINMQGVGRGGVFWPEENNAITGYQVGKLSTSGTFKEDVAKLERLGFTYEMQQEGFWVIRESSLELDESGMHYSTTRCSTPGIIYAHFNPVAETWHAAYRNGKSRQDDPIKNWELADHLYYDEKEIVERIARETAMLADTAVTLQENHGAYYALRRNLLERAEKTSPQDYGAMVTLLESWRIWPPALYTSFAPSTYSQLENYAQPLYRALAGKGVRDSTGVEAIQALVANPGGVTAGMPLMIAENTLCPAYEPTDQGLIKAVVSELVLQPN